MFPTDGLVSKYKLRNTFPLIDDLTTRGKDQNDHDKSIEKFEIAVKNEELTMNGGKCVYSTTTTLKQYPKP